MSAKALRIIVLLSFVLISGSALLAQEAHPAKGVWIGHYGPTLTPQSRLVLVLDYDGTNISGVLNPGTNPAPLKVARMDITPGRLRAQGVEPIMPVFKLHLEAEGKDAQGRTVNIVIDGTMNNVPLGNRTLTGTYSATVAGGQPTRADFEVQRQ